MVVGMADAGHPCAAPVGQRDRLPNLFPTILINIFSKRGYEVPRVPTREFHGRDGLFQARGYCQHQIEGEGASMDFSAKLENLKAKVDEVVTSARAAAAEDREQLKQRVDQAQDEANKTVQDARQRADQAADRAQSKWAEMKTDAAARREDFKAKIDKRANQLDAKAAATDADWAEQDAADAIDYAIWVVSDAQLAVLDALDARAYADERAKIASS
jgi:hypothetical protein